MISGEDINPASESVSEVTLAGAKFDSGGGGVPREVRGEDRPWLSEDILVIISFNGGGAVDLRRGVAVVGVRGEVEVERDCVEGEDD